MHCPQLHNMGTVHGIVGIHLLSITKFDSETSEYLLLREVDHPPVMTLEEKYEFHQSTARRRRNKSLASDFLGGRFNSTVQYSVDYQVLLIESHFVSRNTSFRRKMISGKKPSLLPHYLALASSQKTPREFTSPQKCAFYQSQNTNNKLTTTSSRQHDVSKSHHDDPRKQRRRHVQANE